MTTKRRKMNDLNKSVEAASNDQSLNDTSSSYLLHTDDDEEEDEYFSSASPTSHINASVSTHLVSVATNEATSHNETSSISNDNEYEDEEEEEDIVFNTNNKEENAGTGEKISELGEAYSQSDFFKTDHSYKLLSMLDLMRSNETLCDYEIRCNDKSFFCHKCVLIAMSDFFKVMLTSGMKESKENFVVLKGFKTAMGVKSILDFIYTGVINISFENLHCVLDAASHLQVNEILNLCTDFLIKNLTVLNCVSILRLADKFCLNYVINTAQQYLNDNISEIYQNANEQFNQLSYDQLKSLLNNDSLEIYSELELFIMIVKWIEGDQTSASENKANSRLKYAVDLIQRIRFMCISAEDLADHVECVDFMNTIPECKSILMDAYRYHALPKRQPLIKSDQTKLRSQETLVAVGETNIFALNEAKQKWDVVCQAPLDENYPYPFNVITINNYLYVLGSRQRTTGEEYKSCYRFSPRTLEWIPLAPLLNDRSRFGIANIDNYIYIFGGFEGFKRSRRVYLKSIERYSIEKDKWEEFSSDGPMMSCMASCSYQNLIYFGGGKDINWRKISDFYSIDVTNKKMTKKANMLTARTTHQITVVNDSIYVLGGFDDAGNGILSIESYNVKEDQWSLVTMAPGTFSKTWPQCLGIINNRFYISVFHTPNTFKILQKGYYYDLNTNVWSEAPVISERARYSPTCCLTFPRKCYNSNSFFAKVGQQNDLIKSKNSAHGFSKNQTTSSNRQSINNSNISNDLTITRRELTR